MNLSALSQRALGDTQLYLRKHGPAILTGAGVLGFVGTTVLVHRAAIKAKPVVDDIKHGLNAIENTEIDSNYTKAKKGQDYGRALVDAAHDLGKIYAPSIIVGAVSVTCVISAHGMLRKQNAALLGAYAALDLGFKAYRQRVAEEFGEDRERDIWRGVTGRHEEKDGNGQVCVIEDFATDKYRRSPYGRFFDETSKYFSDTPEYNLVFLKSQQNWANDRLRSRGHLFLNEVYDELGLPRSQMGQFVGWKVDKDGKPTRANDDGYVDFGMYDITDEVSRAFINGVEKVIFLDFNVDGPIDIDE